MTRPEDAPNPGLATAAVEDQPAEAAEQAAEPAVCSEAEPGAAGEPQADAAPAKIDSEGPSPKVKSPSAKVKPSEPVQSEERPSGRRERKQTAFFQPEKKTETEKLEIKEAGFMLPLPPACSGRLFLFLQKKSSTNKLTVHTCTHNKCNRSTDAQLPKD